MFTPNYYLKKEVSKMFDAKVWGWVKLIAAVIAFWWAWNAGVGMNLAGAVAILAGLKVLGGLMTLTGTKLK